MSRGFSLLELILSLAIAASLLLLSIHSFAWMKEKAQRCEVEGAARFLSFLRAKALSEGEDLTVSCEGGGLSAKGKQGSYLYRRKDCYYHCKEFTLTSTGFVVPAATLKVKCSLIRAKVILSMAGRLRIVW